MKVSSPIGDLPFRLDRIRPSRDGVELTGRMGAWPAHVTVQARDALDMARAAAPLLAPLTALTALVVARRWRRR